MPSVGAGAGRPRYPAVGPDKFVAGGNGCIAVPGPGKSWRPGPSWPGRDRRPAGWASGLRPGDAIALSRRAGSLSPHTGGRRPVRYCRPRGLPCDRTQWPEWRRRYRGRCRAGPAARPPSRGRRRDDRRPRPGRICAGCGLWRNSPGPARRAAPGPIQPPPGPLYPASAVRNAGNRE